MQSKSWHKPGSWLTGKPRRPAKGPASKPGRAEKSTGSSRPAPSRWYCVSIIASQSACAAIRKVATKRWLSAEAPRFPIEGCDARHCDCRYRHHADRRAKVQRKSDRDGAIGAVDRERRERRQGSRGRRVTDV